MKTTPLLSALNSQSKSFHALNPHLFIPTAKQVVEEGKRIRQESKPLINKLETAWYQVLKSIYQHVKCQAIRFKLGNGIWYKPDFVATDDSGQWIAFEVKGPHAFRGGFENLKVAAHCWPRVKWILVWKEQGQWKQQEVLP